jgi:SAM-dependent methyltransferase
MDNYSPNNCVICKNSSFIKLFTVEDFDNLKASFDLFKCNTCGFTQIFPFLVEEQLDKYYQKTYYGVGNKKFISVIENFIQLTNKCRAFKINKFLSEINRPKQNLNKKVLDLGCGRGLLLKAFHNMGFDCYGVERSDLVSFHEDDITVINKNLKDIGFKTASMDVVVLWHVLEHLLDPVAIFDELTRILGPNGLLVLSVPNFNSIQARFFRKHWFHLDIPRHPYHFSLEPLDILLSRNNYTIIHKSTFSLEQNIFGFIQSSFNKFLFFFPKNSFYLLLKKEKHSFLWFINLFFWIILFLFVIPFALAEYLISGAMKKGAVLTLYAKKTRRGRNWHF